jgi:DNA-binding transcriptional regulator GbsR (MarR family)
MLVPFLKLLLAQLPSLRSSDPAKVVASAKENIKREIDQTRRAIRKCQAENGKFQQKVDSVQAAGNKIIDSVQSLVNTKVDGWQADIDATSAAGDELVEFLNRLEKIYG